MQQISAIQMVLLCALALQDGSSRRVVVTGMGLVSPLGHEVREGVTCRKLAGNLQETCVTAMYDWGTCT
jgi:hypothetical protein